MFEENFKGIDENRELSKMKIRKYNCSDCDEIANLFYDTVHSVNAKDYSKEQLDAWATGHIELEKWNRSFLEHKTFIAEQDGKIIGFGDIDEKGYLDRLYVHKDFQRKGVATALCKKLEEFANGEITTHASITAKPFFEKLGYKATKEQHVERNGIILTNFVMEKKK